MKKKDETISDRRKRLFFRSNRRGMREMDMILAAFARQYLDDFDARRLEEYEALLNHPDNDLYAWISGRAVVPEKYHTRVLDLFIHYQPHRLET